MSNEEHNLRDSDPIIIEQPYHNSPLQNNEINDTNIIGNPNSGTQNKVENPHYFHLISRIFFISFSIWHIFRFFSVWNPNLDESLPPTYILGIWLFIILDCMMMKWNNKVDPNNFIEKNNISRIIPNVASDSSKSSDFNQNSSSPDSVIEEYFPNKEDEPFQTDEPYETESSLNSPFSQTVNIEINGIPVGSYSFDGSFTQTDANSSTFSNSNLNNSDKSYSDRIAQRSDNFYRTIKPKEKNLHEKKESLLKEKEWHRQMLVSEMEKAIRSNDQKQLARLKENEQSQNREYYEKMNKIANEEKFIRDQEDRLKKEIDEYRLKIINGDSRNWTHINNDQRNYNQFSRLEKEKQDRINRENSWMEDNRMRDLERAKKDALYRAEMAKKRDAQHQLDVSRREDSARKAAESKNAEAARYAARQAESAKRADEAKKAASAKKAEEVKKVESAKKAAATKKK